ncbi:hypothetical protein [Kibdelosporangium philippinense]|uniref:hypothetical protein n=1 Tax=Kibdelosporangium philippinense TaxID=211113 RepID=UPI0036227319
MSRFRSSLRRTRVLLSDAGAEVVPVTKAVAMEPFLSNTELKRASAQVEPLDK